MGLLPVSVLEDSQLLGEKSGKKCLSISHPNFTEAHELESF
jgi:hypothetical protein